MTPTFGDILQHCQHTNSDVKTSEDVALGTMTIVGNRFGTAKTMRALLKIDIDVEE